MQEARVERRLRASIRHPLVRRKETQPCAPKIPNTLRITKEQKKADQLKKKQD
jgi:hypothetical protein